jgi:hypothetical protein
LHFTSLIRQSYFVVLQAMARVMEEGNFSTFAEGKRPEER